MQILLNKIVVVVDVNTEAGDKENKQTNKQTNKKKKNRKKQLSVIYYNASSLD